MLEEVWTIHAGQVSQTDVVIIAAALLDSSSPVHPTSYSLTRIPRLFDCTINIRDLTADESSTNITTGFSVIGEACPGVQYLYSHNSSTPVTVLNVHLSDCDYTLSEYNARHTVVHGTCDATQTFCKMHVQAPRPLRAQARAQRLAYWCDSRQWKSEMTSSFGRFEIRCGHHTLRETSVVPLQSHNYITNVNSPPVKISIDTIKRYAIIVQHVSELAGYLTLSNNLRLNGLDMSENITAPSGHVIMLSVRQAYQMSVVCSEQNSIKLVYRKQNASHTSVAHLCANSSTPAFVVFTSHLQVKLNYFVNDHNGISIHFSALVESQQPVKLSSGLFNCSVGQYTKFQQHLHCNIKPECEDRQDETEHCPFSSADCQGLVASRHKCFRVIKHGSPLVITIFDYHCKVKHERLASIKTREDQNGILAFFQNYASFRVVLGFVSGWNWVPFAYSRFRAWYDNTVIYNMNHFEAFRPYRPKRIVQSMIFHSMTLAIENNIENMLSSRIALCEIPTRPVSDFLYKIVTAPLHEPRSVLRSTKQFLAVGPDSHVTHSVLLCDSSALFCTFRNVSCGHRSPLVAVHNARQYRYPMFRCGGADVSTVPHTAVCDFTKDCADNSDESFCQRPPCHGFLCTNQQCVSLGQRCNQFSDCLDDSDEKNCPEGDYIEPCEYCHPVQESGPKQTFYTNLDGTGYFTQQVMGREHSCPDSHYQCPSEWRYCLPVYTRCNGFSDCIHGEDEQDCDTVTCPGFYRCRSSTVCMHNDHLCDGWAQCPQRDDEMTCDMTCPEGCLCQGRSFLCAKPFGTDPFPDLRYVDAAGSEMSLAAFSDLTYLTRLSLSSCSLVNVSGEKLINLQFLDLTNNQLRTLDFAVFLELPNLRILQMTNNPLSQLTGRFRKHIHYELRRLDIAVTRLRILDKVLSVYLPQLQHFNISFSDVETIASTGFRYMPKLTQVDTRANPVKNFPLNLFSGSDHLQDIYSSNYRLCCELLLPSQVVKVRCVVPDTMLPSCTTLLPSELLRVFFSGVTVFAVLGSVLCLITAFLSKHMFDSNFLTAVAQLQFADICMGGHVSITLAADDIFEGRYIVIEKLWTGSVACKAAWCLSFLSCEVSVLVTCVITLGHVTALYGPRGRWSFSKASTAVACVVTWCVGLVLSLVPFLPALSEWRLFGDSALCRVAVFDLWRSEPEVLWFTATVIVNCTVSLIIVAGQAAIHRKTPKYRIVLDPAKKLIHSSVRLMGKMAVADAAFWFVLGLVMTMTSNGVTFSDKLYDVMAVFVLPFSSALRPAVFLWTLVTQRSAQTQEQRLVEVLTARRSRQQKRSSQNKGMNS